MCAAPAPRSDDADLVAEARQGDRHAFTFLVERHRAMAVRLCRRVLSDWDLAEDVVQEAATEAHLSLDRLRRDEAFGPWLCGIALNLARRRLRYRALEPWSLDAAIGGRWIADFPDSEPDPAEEVVIRELADAVAQAIGELPDGQREAVLLFYYEGLTISGGGCRVGGDGGLGQGSDRPPIGPRSEVSIRRIPVERFRWSSLQQGE